MRPTVTTPVARRDYRSTFLCRRHSADDGVAAGAGPGRRGKPLNRYDECGATSPSCVRQELAWRCRTGLAYVCWRKVRRAAILALCARARTSRHDDCCGADEWLLIEWPRGEAAPTKYWLSTLSAKSTFESRRPCQVRWRIERDYQELKQELGLGHLKAADWRGLHHHATLCIAAYGYLVAERADDSPLRTSFHRSLQGACVTQRLSTQGLPPCGLNVTFQTRSPPCAYD